MTTLAAELFRHHAWATDRLLEFCLGLPDEELTADAKTTYGSIAETLAHLVGSEAYFVFALTGRWIDPPLEEDASPAVAELRSRAHRTGEALVEIAKRTSPTAVVTLPRRRVERSLPVGAILSQALHHGATHREQVVSILSARGIRPPDMSGWAFGGDASADYA